MRKRWIIGIMVCAFLFIACGGGGSGGGDAAGPGVVSALATGSTSVRITFDSEIEPASVLAGGSQFSFTGGLTASSAAVSGVYVTVTTTAQTAAMSYTVTVEDTVTDPGGAGVGPADSAADFAGFSATSVVINELYYDAPSQDTEVFAELTSLTDADLAGLSLVGINGSIGLEYVVIPISGTLAAADYFVVADTSTNTFADLVDPGADFQNGPDSLRLIFDYGGPDEFIVDELGYGYGGEGTPANDVAAGNSLSRCPDGDDTDNNFADFSETIPSPGSSNTCE